jgi:hypothetical protein
VSTLRQQFSEDFADLVLKAPSLMNGLTVSIAEVLRTPQQALLNAQKGVGIVHSLHIYGLAGDLLVFIDGAYQKDDSSGAYKALGECWKGMGPDHYWGGDFKSVDLDHFSLSPDGGITR